MTDSKNEGTFGSMKKYRDATDILYTMLQHMRSQSRTKTDIMFEARMSYTQMKDYMKMLLEKYLIQETGKGRASEAYVTTEKGIQVINAIEGLRELMK